MNRSMVGNRPNDRKQDNQHERSDDFVLCPHCTIETTLVQLGSVAGVDGKVYKRSKSRLGAPLWRWAARGQFVTE